MSKIRYPTPPNLTDVSNRNPEEDSPYPEVRSAVANTDDPGPVLLSSSTQYPTHALNFLSEMVCATVRAWTIGLVLSIVISGLNQFFNLRFPSVQLNSFVFLSEIERS